MKNSRMSFKSAGAWLFLMLFLGAAPAPGDQLFAPEYLWQRNIASKTKAIDIADTHIGIPYRDDGALDSNGNFTTFNRPDVIYRTPGLNCSGLVLSVSRFLFHRNFSLEQASLDRQNNSGRGSPLGKDWDFGLDLILNLTEGVPRKVISPDGKEYSPDKGDGMQLTGFDLHDPDSWQRVLSQMRPGYAYFGSISKPTRRPGYRLLHYHVVLMLPEEKGGIWLYHSTRRSNVHRMNIRTAQGMRRFMSQFGDSPGEPKKILVVEAAIPGAKSEPQTAAATESAPVPGAADRLGDADTATGKAPEIPGSLAQERTGTSLNNAPQEQTPSEENAAPARPASLPAATIQEQGPSVVVNHLSGKVFKSFPELLTHIPQLADGDGSGIKLWFSNGGKTERNLEILVRGPQGDLTYRGRLPGNGNNLTVIYPRDFGRTDPNPVQLGRYGVEVKIDGVKWCANIVEVVAPKDAKPEITTVAIPQAVSVGSTFAVRVVAQNSGVESDYGGITLSCPNPSGLRFVSAQPGRIYGSGSTVLSVTSDKIKTKVPMAERWIDLWGERKVYDIKVTIRAERPGTYPIYVRCALRSANVKSSVILMDPQTSDTVDQQGFPVHVHMVTVR